MNMKNFPLGFFTECINGIWKPSMNRLIAFLSGGTCCFVAIWSVVHKTPVPDATIIEFFGFVTALLGISGYNKMVDTKSTTANPNLPPPTI